MDWLRAAAAGSGLGLPPDLDEMLGVYQVTQALGLRPRDFDDLSVWEVAVMRVGMYHSSAIAAQQRRR